MSAISVRRPLLCVLCGHFLFQRLFGLVLRDFAHDLDLVRDIFKRAKDFSITIDKTELRIRKALLLRELFDQNAGAAKIVAWQAGEKVVRDLEV